MRHSRVFRISRILALSIGISVPYFASAEATSNVYTLADALGELHDLNLLLEPATPPRRSARLSSNDPNGAGDDQGQFLRQEGQEFVLMDIEGPGVLTRLWTAEPMGYLRFYFDGSPQPAIGIPWLDLADGKVPPLVPPFVSTEAGGCTMQFPLTFEKGLKVTLSSHVWSPWTIDYSYFPPETKVESWPNAMQSRASARSNWPEALRGAGDAWLAPLSQTPVGELRMLEPRSFHADASELVYTADAPTLVTEIVFKQSDSEVIPGALSLRLPGSDTAIPWRALTGVWSSTDDSMSLRRGRQGVYTYYRIPFVLDTGEKLAFRWEGDSAGEAVGSFAVRTSPSKSPWPKPVLSYTHTTVGAGKGFESPTLEGFGRLLSLGLHATATVNSAYVESDLSIALEGEEPASILGMRLEDIFGAGTYFSEAPFAAPLSSVSVWSDDLLNFGATGDFGIVGTPFADSISLELEAGTLNEAPPTEYEVLLVAQAFNDPVKVESPLRREPTADFSSIGKRIVTGVDAAGLPVYTEMTAPIAGRSRPIELRFDDEETLSGNFGLDVRIPGIDRVEVRLDLPYQWKGSLSGAGEEKEVFDIGWPPIELWSPEAQEIDFAWTVTPPATLQGGDYIAQIRAEAFLADGHVYTTRFPVRIQAPTRGESLLDWDGTKFKKNESGGYEVSLPPGFEALPGDAIVVDASASPEDGYRETLATLRFLPVGPTANDKGLPEEYAPMAPVSGTAVARLPLDNEVHRLTFSVGRYSSWIGNPRSFGIELAGVADSHLAVEGARLFRRPAPPAISGWTKRVPYWEMPLETFHMPAGQAILKGAELVQRMEPVVFAPADRIKPHFRSADYLENVEAGPLGWRIADSPWRTGEIDDTISYDFQSRLTGSRLRIEDPRIAGQRFFGFEFGYGPECGTVAVRDCEGRLAAVQDTWLNEPVALPQWTWVALQGPSRDGFIYLESLGPAPGSLEQHIVIQKFMIVTNIDE